MSRQLVHNISDSKKINKNGKQRKSNVRITKKSNDKKSNTKKKTILIVAKNIIINIKNKLI